MEATYGAVVSLNYTLSLDDGAVVEAPQESFEYLHGYNNIVPGLEKALDRVQPGDRKSIVVEPAEGYGEHFADRMITVPIDRMPDGMSLEPGVKVMAETGRGPVTLTVSEVGDDTVVLDANHPLAGKTLHFDVEVLDVRNAARHELQQGHPGPQACTTFS
jgi:FKBP-type peptidyl-prolyl cis-trans isomerase SlyD